MLDIKIKCYRLELFVREFSILPFTFTPVLEKYSGLTLACKYNWFSFLTGALRINQTQSVNKTTFLTGFELSVKCPYRVVAKTA